MIVRDGVVDRITASGAARPQGFLFQADPGVEWVLLPAGIDPQVHLRVPGQSEKETPEGGLRALRAGGICAALAMPNTRPVIDDVPALRLARAQIADWPEAWGVRILWSPRFQKASAGKNLSIFNP